MKDLKVYDLVWVKLVTTGIQHRCLGQVISRPIGDGNIMVRLVPDDPSTMRSVPIESLSLCNKNEYKWVAYFEVKGSFSFPVDMLRYDNCVPVNFKLDEDGNVEVELKEMKNSDSEVLIVAKACQTKARCILTDARWRSFGWSTQLLAEPLKIVGR